MKKKLISFSAFLCFGFLLAAVSISPKLDLTVSSWFYQQSRFCLDEGGFDWLIRRGIPAFLGLSGLAVFGLWILGRLRGRAYWGVNTPKMLITFGTLILGTGVIVNGIFKSFWGRARPIDIEPFGGEASFSLPLMVSHQCRWDCSFMSGHTSIAFWAVSLAVLLPKHLRKYWVVIALLIGTITGVARIAQGMHFLSDVLFAAAVNLLLVYAFYYWFGSREKI